MLQQTEYEQFALVCRRQGYSAHQFDLFADDFGEVAGGQVAIARDVVVTHLDSATRRRYVRDHFASWLDAFEADLRAGRFSAHVHEW